MDYALISEMCLTVVVWEFYLSLYVNADIYEVILHTVYLVVYQQNFESGPRNKSNKD